MEAPMRRISGITQRTLPPHSKILNRIIRKNIYLSTIDWVAKFWNFCRTLRHEGSDYKDYMEELTYLLFLKIRDERGLPIQKDIIGRISSQLPYTYLVRQ